MKTVVEYRRTDSAEKRSGFEIRCGTCAGVETVGLSPHTPINVVENKFKARGWYIGTGGATCAGCMRRRRGRRPRDYNPEAAALIERTIQAVERKRGWNLHEVLSICRDNNISVERSHSWVTGQEALLVMSENYALRADRLAALLDTLRLEYKHELEAKIGCQLFGATTTVVVNVRALVCLHVILKE